MTERTVTVTATGEATAVPTRGCIELRATGEGASAAEARERARDHEARVRDALATAGVDDVRSTEFSLDDPTERFDCDDSDDYRATAALSVDVPLDGVEEALVAATDAGATVHRLGTGVAAETRESLEREAVTAAMATAHGKAEAAAAAADGGLGSVRAVEVEPDDSFESIVESSIEWQDTTEFRPDPVAVAAAVEVTYELRGE
ncbi:SIMPL domain-containing protein [Halorarius halobius]|uniref:SIMPL domain-containing protein n=1 Tax=Halorarius halobius TaxID=2962671 RepID=UPI0020CC75EA|nr:SIMPL domain-containing protein [Halorarius halobius]